MITGVWYAFKGELFLFLLSTLVAIEHECAHAFASAKLGYRLNTVVLMPFGAIIDGDLQGLSFKDEIVIALWGPLCNLLTALFFIALWWIFPTLYALTDVVVFSSLSVALVNLLPAYPLDGGRILRCALVRLFSKKQAEQTSAPVKAERITKGITLVLATLLLGVFVLQCVQKTPNFTLLAFGLFLLFGGLGNQDKGATYERMDFALRPALDKGVEIRRVAIIKSRPVKDVFRFLNRESYLVLEVYDDNGAFLFTLTQNELSHLFLKAESPYESLEKAQNRAKMQEKSEFLP